MQSRASIFVAGHRGLVGSAILRRLQQAGYSNLVTRTRAELDLADQSAVDAFFDRHPIDYVFLAAAKVGGIHANDTYRAEFIYQNLITEANVIHAAWRYGVKDLLFLGSSCVYPRDCPQPMREEHLLSGPLEATNEPYAIAKIAGIKLCESYNRQYATRYVSVMPTNLYGVHDNFDLQTSHVIPAVIRKVHDAKVTSSPTVTLWGSGAPRREFLYVDDLADACVHLMENPGGYDLINIGSGEEVTIRELGELVCEVVGYSGQIVFDPGKPDGTPRKLLDSSRISASGWRPATDLRTGLAKVYQWYLEQLRTNAVA